MLQRLPEFGKLALLSLYNCSLVEHQVTSSWRRAVIIPVLKNDKDPAAIRSYCPVALLSVLSKGLEALVKTRLEYWARRTVGAIPSEQAGFLFSLSLFSLISLVCLLASSDIKIPRISNLEPW
jgi:hypothetical protein